MADYDAIQKLLDQHLNGGSFGLDIAWENVSFTPSNDSPFIRPTLLPGGLAQFGLAIGDSNEVDGVYQIDIFYPSGSGTGVPRRKADEVINHFRRGTLLSVASPRLQLRESFRNPGIQETDWFQIPVVVNWKAFFSN